MVARRRVLLRRRGKWNKKALDKKESIGYNGCQAKGVDGKKMRFPLAQRAGGRCEPVRDTAWILAPEPPV